MSGTNINKESQYLPDLEGLTGREKLAKMFISLGVLFVYALSLIIIIAVAAFVCRGVVFIFMQFWQLLDHIFNH